MVDETMINLLKTTRDRIKKNGTMNQSYDEALNMILDFWEVNHPSWDRELIETNMEVLGPRDTNSVIEQIKNREIVILDIDGKMVLIKIKDTPRNVMEESDRNDSRVMTEEYKKEESKSVEPKENINHKKEESKSVSNKEIENNNKKESKRDEFWGVEKKK
jgi:hypothetical protein